MSTINKTKMRSKYPRTYHLPWSPGVQSDDKVIESLDCFIGKEVVVTEKLDGENTTLYPDYMHARSIDSRHNFTRDWVKRMHCGLKTDIPEGMRFCGENMWAEHAIRYEDNRLSGYFYLYSVWDQDLCLSYEYVELCAEACDLPTPQKLYQGVYSEDVLRQISSKLDLSKIEGYVVRSVGEFKEEDFHLNVAKFVRPNHVQQNAEHWLKSAKQNGKLNTRIMPGFMAN